MRITVLGSGTSHGVPMLGCRCPVCVSADPRNRRMRCSAAVQWTDPGGPATGPKSGPSLPVRVPGRTILIDTTPELRLQALAAGIDRVDAVVITHGHADHVMGLDDTRRFSELARAALPVLAAPQDIGRLMQVFEYALTDASYGMFGVPVVEWRPFVEPVPLGSLRLTPVPLRHGPQTALGLRVDAPGGKSLAWCPDTNGVPPPSMDLLRGLDVLFLDGLRHTPHPTHFTVAESVEVIRALRPRQAYLIHMTHDLDHEATERALPQGIRLAYDGMTVDLGTPE